MEFRGSCNALVTTKTGPASCSCDAGLLMGPSSGRSTGLQCSRCQHSPAFHNIATGPSPGPGPQQTSQIGRKELLAILTRIPKMESSLSSKIADHRSNAIGMVLLFLVLDLSRYRTYTDLILQRCSTVPISNPGFRPLAFS